MYWIPSYTFVAVWILCLIQKSYIPFRENNLVSSPGNKCKSYQVMDGGIVGRRVYSRVIVAIIYRLRCLPCLCSIYRERMNKRNTLFICPPWYITFSIRIPYIHVSESTSYNKYYYRRRRTSGLIAKIYR